MFKRPVWVKVVPFSEGIQVPSSIKQCDTLELLTQDADYVLKQADCIGYPHRRRWAFIGADRHEFLFPLRLFPDM